MSLNFFNHIFRVQRRQVRQPNSPPRFLQQLRQQSLFNGVAGVIGPNGLRHAMMTQQIRSIRIQINIIQSVVEHVTAFEPMKVVTIPLLQSMMLVAIVLMRINLKKRKMKITQRDVFKSFYFYYIVIYFIFKWVLHLKT